MYAKDSKSSLRDDSVFKSVSIKEEIYLTRTHAKVGIDGGKKGRADPVDVRSFVWYMIQGSRIAVFFGQAKVDDIDQVSSLANTHNKVRRFDIPMHKRMRMDEFDT